MKLNLCTGYVMRLISLLLALMLPVVAHAQQPAAPSSPAAALPAAMSAAEAHTAADAGKVVLIDIRSDDEWRESGVPASAYAISMHQSQPAFLKGLAVATKGDKTTPIALVCATGSRSAFLAGWLKRNGYTAVIDVREGVDGGRYGKGWVKAGLPIRRWQPGAVTPVAAAR